MKNASWERYRSLTVALVATLITAGMFYLMSGTSFLRHKALPPPPSPSTSTAAAKDIPEVEDVTEDEDEHQTQVNVNEPVKKEKDEVEDADKELTNKQIEEYDTKARSLFKEKKHGDLYKVD